MTATRNFELAIVGAGPTGAFLANALGKAGISVALIERARGVCQLPRAVHFDAEVMRALQAIELADDVAGIARASSKGMHFVSSTGQTLLVRRGYDGIGPHDWAGSYYMHQPHLEEVLRKGLARFPNVALRLGEEVVDLRQSTNGIEISVVKAACNATTRLAAKYVVGCDGARSFVRRAIGAENEDLGLHQPWLVVDAIVNPLSKRARALPDHTIQLCDPVRPMTLVSCGGHERRRWEIMLMPGDDPATIIQPSNVWKFLSRWIIPEDATLERAALYTFHSVVASGWRKGRLLLAGDACHQTPPFLGQGMCAGIRDAHNLAWKLRAILKDGAADALLESYETERRSHVLAFIKLAVDLGAIIQTTDPEVARKRDESFLAAGAKMFDFPQPQLGPGIWVDAPPPVGQIFPQPRFDDGSRLDARIGGRFAILATDDFRRELPPELRALAQQAGVLLIEHPSRGVSDWLGAHSAPCVLLRPDAYIYAIPRTASELAAAIDRLSQSMRGHASLT